MTKGFVYTTYSVTWNAVVSFFFSHICPCNSTATISHELHKLHFPWKYKREYYKVQNALSDTGHLFQATLNCLMVTIQICSAVEMLPAASDALWCPSRGGDGIVWMAMSKSGNESDHFGASFSGLMQQHWSAAAACLVQRWRADTEIERYRWVFQHLWHSVSPVEPQIDRRLRGDWSLSA